MRHAYLADSQCGLVRQERDAPARLIGGSGLILAADRFLVSPGYCPGGIAPMTVRVMLLFRYDTLNR